MTRQSVFLKNQEPIKSSVHRFLVPTKENLDSIHESAEYVLKMTFFERMLADIGDRKAVEDS